MCEFDSTHTSCEHIQGHLQKLYIKDNNVKININFLAQTDYFTL